MSLKRIDLKKNCQRNLSSDCSLSFILSEPRRRATTSWSAYQLTNNPVQARDQFVRVVVYRFFAKRNRCCVEMPVEPIGFKRPVINACQCQNNKRTTAVARLSTQLARCQQKADARILKKSTGSSLYNKYTELENKYAKTPTNINMRERVWTSKANNFRFSSEDIQIVLAIYFAIYTCQIRITRPTDGERFKTRLIGFHNSCVVKNKSELDL